MGKIYIFLFTLLMGLNTFAAIEVKDNGTYPEDQVLSELNNKVVYWSVNLALQPDAKANTASDLTFCLLNIDSLITWEDFTVAIKFGKSSRSLFINNGGSYSNTGIQYEYNHTYHFWMSLDFATKKYDVYYFKGDVVNPEEIKIVADNYGFRNTNVDSLKYWNIVSNPDNNNGQVSLHSVGLTSDKGLIPEQLITVENESLTGIQGPSIRLIADDYKQIFYGTGGSCGLYLYNYFNMSQEDRMLGSKMLVQDAKLKYVKIYEHDYPEIIPDRYDKCVEFVNNAKFYDPDIHFQLNVNNLPDHLEKDKGVHDGTIPGILDSIANYYYRACKGYYDRGLIVHQLDVVNERGYSEKTHDLFDIVIDKFEEIIADTAVRNTSKVPMPFIVGPSTWSAKAAPTWIENFKTKRGGNAWDNLDIVSSHGYQNGTYENYKKCFEAAEGKMFINSEQTGRIQDDEGTGVNAVDDLARQYRRDEEPDYIGDVSIAMRMSDVINAGGNIFFAFLTHNTKGNNAALIKTSKDEGPTKSKIYDGFRHISSPMPDSSHRIERILNEMNEYRVVTMRKEGEDTVYVMITNIWDNSHRVRVAVGKDSLGNYGIKAVKGWTSNEILDYKDVLDKEFDQSVDMIAFNTTPHSVNTLKIVLDINGPANSMQDQTLLFPKITEIPDSVSTYILKATASSNLPVSFELVSGPASVSNDTLKINGIGKITVRAFQPGNDSILASKVLTQTFCVNPEKPQINVNDNDITSTINADSYQWYRDGNTISGTTSKKYTIDKDGEYAVEISINNCSNISENVQVDYITGISKHKDRSSMYQLVKNNGILEITNASGVEIKKVQLYNAAGILVNSIHVATSKTAIDISALKKGLYIVLIKDSEGTLNSEKLLLF